MEVDTLGLLEGIGATFGFPTPSRSRYFDRIREDSDVRCEDSFRLLLLIFVLLESSSRVEIAFLAGIVATHVVALSKDRLSKLEALEACHWLLNGAMRDRI